MYITSKFRKLYQYRLVFRSALLVFTIMLYFLVPESFEVLKGFNAVKQLSILQVFWGLWVFDMVMQLIPTTGYWPLGSQKQFKEYFQPLKGAISLPKLQAYVEKSKHDTLLIGGIWLGLTLILGGLYGLHILGYRELFIIAVVFYVCDVICVLYWCPFRVFIMKNRCCTTCRIFNWDHLMMFLPLVFIPGLYTWSLFLMALVVFLVWEVLFYTYPERFWEGSNETLKCNNCEDKLCGKREFHVNPRYLQNDHGYNPPQ